MLITRWSADTTYRFEIIWEETFLIYAAIISYCHGCCCREFAYHPILGPPEILKAPLRLYFCSWNTIIWEMDRKRGRDTLILCDHRLIAQSTQTQMQRWDERVNDDIITIIMAIIYILPITLFIFRRHNRQSSLLCNADRLVVRFYQNISYQESESA